MHHSKNFSNYSTQKKTFLIVALIGKFVVFGTVLAGLAFFLKDSTSPTMLLLLMHIILFACVGTVIFFHKRKKNHEHEEECNCEVK